MHKAVLLLVEDNPDDAELSLQAFRKNQRDAEIVLARDGEEALEYIFATGRYTSREPAIPNVILLDLNLPKLDGTEVLRRLRTDPRTSCVPVVILTSSDDARDVARGYDLGANSFVRKPVDFAEYVETLQRLEMYWLGVNQPPPGQFLLLREPAASAAH